MSLKQQITVVVIKAKYTVAEAAEEFGYDTATQFLRECWGLTLADVDDDTRIYEPELDYGQEYICEEPGYLVMVRHNRLSYCVLWPIGIDGPLLPQRADDIKKLFDKPEVLGVEVRSIYHQLRVFARDVLIDQARKETK